MTQIAAVVFDLGGVVCDSPLHAINRFEAAQGLEHNALNRAIANSGPTGAWSRLERGELEPEAFVAPFTQDLKRAGFDVDGGALFAAIRSSSEPRPVMLEAIARIRSSALQVAALTNNWRDDEDDHPMQDLFDVVIESAKTGVRKPDPKIYQLTCEALGVEFYQAAFLDDIGANLKAARALGMTTIKVDDPLVALRKLEELLGFPLLDA